MEDLEVEEIENEDEIEEEIEENNSNHESTMSNKGIKVEIEEIETEDETEDEDESIEDYEQMINIEPKFASKNDKDLRFEWYKFSARFIPDKYKLQYVHKNAHSQNERKILNWYNDCIKVGLLPRSL